MRSFAYFFSATISYDQETEKSIGLLATSLNENAPNFIMN